MKTKNPAFILQKKLQINNCKKQKPIRIASGTLLLKFYSKKRTNLCGFFVYWKIMTRKA
jgi:hypothetical protein